MKIITIPEKFRRMDGTPFRLPKRDEDGEAILKRDSQGNYLRDGEGNIFVEMEVADFFGILKDFINSVFVLARRRTNPQATGSQVEKLKMEDSGIAYDIFRAINASVDRKFELENHPYDWLIKKVDEYGVDIQGRDAIMIKEVLSKTEDVPQTRAEKRREK